MDEQIQTRQAHEECSVLFTYAGLSVPVPKTLSEDNGLTGHH